LDGATGWLNSEVAPSLEVAVAAVCAEAGVASAASAIAAM